VIIREFVILIASKFDPKGFRQADAAAESLADSSAEAAAATRRLGDEQKAASGKAKSNADANREASAAARDASGRFVGAGRSASVASSRFSALRSAAAGAAQTLRNMAGGASSLSGPLTAAGAGLAALVTGATVGAGAIIKQGATFESLRTQLTTLYGDAGKAEEAFAGIRDFAKRTPFEVEELTEAFIALKTRGVNPTNEVLTGLGDLASSRGRNIKDMVDAVSAAARGELDPLEGFIDGARVAGDKLALTFRGQTYEVERNAAAVTKQLAAFGEMEGVQGGMAAQSKTTAGVISNLKDGIANFFDEVAQLGVLDEFKALLGDLANLGGDGEGGLARILADSLVTVLRAVREGIQSITAEDIKGFFDAVRRAADFLAETIGFVVTAIRDLVDMSGGLENALMGATAAIAALAVAGGGLPGLFAATAIAAAQMGTSLADAIDQETLATIEQASIAIDGLKSQMASLSAQEAKLRGELAADAAADEERLRLRKKGVLYDRDIADAQRAEAQFEAVAKARREGFGEEFFATAEQQAGSRDVFAGMTAEQVALRKGGGSVGLSESAGRAQARFDEARARELERIRKSGGDVTSRAAGLSANERKARESFTEAIRAGKSEDEAIAEAERTLLGTKKGGKKGGKGTADPFDFAAKVEQAAKQQATEFAAQEFERFRFQGMAVQEALDASKAAGKQREGELRKLFLDAGRIYDANAKGILDILGLRGPGSVLEGRPPPQTLIITISPVITFIKEFSQSNTFQNPGATVTAATAAGGQAAVEAGMEPFKAKVMEWIESMFSLQGDRLIKAGASGTLPQGPEA
jgi:hypothetical protein